MIVTSHGHKSSAQVKVISHNNFFRYRYRYGYGYGYGYRYRYRYRYSHIAHDKR